MGIFSITVFAEKSAHNSKSKPIIAIADVTAEMGSICEPGSGCC
jgi:hypothetical protein